MRVHLTDYTGRSTSPDDAISGQGRAPVIDVAALGKRFGDVEAVREVTFRVSEGEVFGFLGPNGAGKTTTIHMLCTLLRPTSGQAAVAGFDVVRQRDAVRRSIGLVFQNTTLDDALTAEQNLRFHAYAYGVPGGVRERRIEELLSLVELAERRRDRVRNFSGGMKRRLELARGLLHRPRVLFLDEPTLGLDPQTRRRVWDYIAELHGRERLTVFMTTHYLDEAEQCDRIAIIDDGRIVALDSPDALKRAAGGDRIAFTTAEPTAAAEELREHFRLSPILTDGSVTFHVPNGEAFLPDFVRSFSLPLEAISLRRPTLDDVFLDLTGRQIRDGDEVPTKTSMEKEAA
jgi:ABC-2 type transport system ATP-binding protein